MRKLGFIAAALALGACNPATDTTQSPLPEAANLPNVYQASYRAEVTSTSATTGDTTELIMVRDGQRMRIETPDSIVIVNPEEALVISGEGRNRMAMRVDSLPIADVNAQWSGEFAASATRTGSCTVAGETGSEWSRTPEGATTPTSACVTDDGIVLRGVEDGRTTWEVTSLTRGAQDPALFTLPAGVRVMDMNSMMQDAMAQAKAAQEGR